MLLGLFLSYKENEALWMRLLTNGPKKLECYIPLLWRNLLVTNTTSSLAPFINYEKKDPCLQWGATPFIRNTFVQLTSVQYQVRSWHFWTLHLFWPKKVFDENHSKTPVSAIRCHAFHLKCICPTDFLRIPILIKTVITWSFERKSFGYQVF